VPEHCLIACINDRMRKTFCSACMCYDLLWTLFMNEEACLLLHIEGSFVLLPEDDMTTVVVTWQRDSKWQLLQLRMLLHRRRLNLLSCNVGWWYSRGTETLASAPLQNNSHLLNYCSAQLTLTVNCKHRLQYIGFSVSI